MASVSPRCSSNSFVYNTTLCACDPGFLYNATANGCYLFRVAGGEQLVVDSGVDYSITFPETIFSFDSIKKFTQSQAVFLEATLFLLVSWLLFCFFVRFGKLGDGRSIWFRIRWWISRLDVCFATRHWLDDQKVVRKRKTELGGTLSIASWILFIGLFAALLYQIISKRTVEVHNVKATNAPDLASFINDMEFNITTISSMSCSNLRGLGTLVIGNPGFVDHRITSLSTFANYSCQNTTKGPIINLKCNNCQIFRDSAHISWQFIDLPNDPAMAVGFQFNLSAKNHANQKHVSHVSGTLKNGSSSNDQPITFRGVEGNVLKFNLFPRIYRNLHDLKLIQPLFHEFLPGSSFNEITQLQDSLQNTNDGLINTTLYINFLSAYIVEIDNQNILGPVSFLADLGGLYCISIGIFFYLMVQCEYRIKKLRNEDGVMRRIRSHRKAQERWDKLRKYVRYTWGCSAMDDKYKIVERDLCCIGGMTGSSRKTGSSHKRAQQNSMHTISFNKKVNSPSEKISQKATPGLSDCQWTKSASNMEKASSELNHTQGAKSASNLERRFSCSGVEPVLKSEAIEDLKEGRHEHPVGSHEGDVSLPQSLPTANDCTIPPPPSLEFKAGSEVNISDIQKNLQALYEYNTMLREKLVAAQSMLNDLTTKGSTSAMDSHT